MTSTFRMVAIDLIERRPQVRESSGLSAEELVALAASIKESGGIHQPLLVRREGERLILLDGERRLRAAKLGGLTEVPVVVTEESLTDAQVTHRQLVLDAQRVGLGPVERAVAVSRLMGEAGWTADQTATKLSVSPASVTRTLALLKLPEPILAHVAAGRITADAAYMLSRIDDPDEQMRTAAQVTEGLLTRDALQRKLRRVRGGKGRPAAGIKSRVTVALGPGRSVTVTGAGLSIETLIEWLEPMLARAKKAKGQGLTLATFVRTLKDQATA
ncbi:MAG: ParB/RepB/Spo0J family partition protein [Phycisphaeraceae bacterium]|nr:ParB/RepB/Spo0J family partition protein [Phycisphaerales bacterium]MCB9843708.1 ParB/RepB/Spo0J family partition protein [Phycisphaeraceae bacterium]